MNDFEKENFERVGGRDDEWVPVSWLGAPGMAAMAWMGVIFYYPLVWAIGTAACIAIASGYGTARAFFPVRSKRFALALSPVFGIVWVVFFWVLFAVFE